MFLTGPRDPHGTLLLYCDLWGLQACMHVGGTIIHVGKKSKAHKVKSKNKVVEKLPRFCKLFFIEKNNCFLIKNSKCKHIFIKFDWLNLLDVKMIFAKQISGLFLNCFWTFCRGQESKRDLLVLIGTCSHEPTSFCGGRADTSFLSCRTDYS